MHTSVRIEGANCPTCFNETLDAIARLEGVRSVHGSMSGPCIEIDHDLPLETIQGTIRGRLHGVEMFGSEFSMVPLEPLATICPLHHSPVEEHPTSGDGKTETVDPSMTLGDIINHRPELAAELERRGLDYCCHGGRTLLEAASSVGLDATAVAGELSAVTVLEAPHNWTSLTPVDLVDHIETIHHHYLRSELPRIGALLHKIVTVHGVEHPELLEVQRVFEELRADLEPHLDREEEELFPIVRNLAAGDHSSETSGVLAARIEGLISEHETVGSLLDEIRRLTSYYTVPADGCASYVACYRALADLEADTHLHVHKENNVLFPALHAAP